MRPGASSPRAGWVICSVLVGIGLAGSAYLLGRVYASLAPAGHATHDLCSVLFGTGCDGALADRRYWILGVPIAGWGLVYFTSLAGLLLLARFVRGQFESDAFLAGSVLTLAGLGVGLALSVSALAFGSPVCPLCLAIHLINLSLLFAFRRASQQPVAEQLGALRAAAGWLLRPGAGTPEAVRWKLVGFGSVALLSALVFQWAYVESALRRPAAPDRAQVLAAYRASPRLALPVTEADPHLGPLSAPVRLVVFESFRCPACRRFAATLSNLRREFRDRLLVVYKHYPLSTACNDRMTRDLQPGACEIAWAAEAAHRQAQFWPFYEALFAAEPEASPEAVAEAVRRLSLDPARFAADRQSDATRARVTEDIALGGRLGIPGTPSVFLDGRLVTPASAEVLGILIRYELGRGKSQGQGRAALHLGRPAREGRHSDGG